MQKNISDIIYSKRKQVGIMNFGFVLDFFFISVGVEFLELVSVFK